MHSSSVTSELSVLEYVDGGSLQDLLNRSPNNRLPLRQLRKIFKGMICGLIYLQGEGIIHRDIKPDNILLTSEGDVKICDLGVAIKIDISDENALKNFKWCHGTGGSPVYQPPECQVIDVSSIPDLDEPLITKRDGKIAPFKLDIWSAGVVLYLMVVGKIPFENPNFITLFTNIARGKFTIPDWIPSELSDLLKGILQVDPDNRLTLHQIKKHSWMTYVIQDCTRNVPIESIPSLFNDTSTLNQILEDLQQQNTEPSYSSGNETNDEDYNTNTDNSEVTDDEFISSSSEDQIPESQESQTFISTDQIPQ